MTSPKAPAPELSDEQVRSIWYDSRSHQRPFEPEYIDFTRAVIAADRALRLASPPAPAPEPAAWITPMRYGSKVTFYKPTKPERWDDDDGVGEWFCKPLYLAVAGASPILPDAAADGGDGGDGSVDPGGVDVHGDLAERPTKFPDAAGESQST